MKVNGKITRHMDLVSINIVLVQFMKGTGKEICSLVSVSKSGWITANMKDLTWMAKNTETACTHGQMAVTTKDPGKTTKSKVMDNTFGTMADLTKASGKTIKCTVMASMSGKMAESTMETMSTIKNKVRANTIGLMVNDFRDVGPTENAKA